MLGPVPHAYLPAGARYWRQPGRRVPLPGEAWNARER
jgi:hypothetical protein